MGIFGTVTFVHKTMWACLGGDRKREKTRMPKEKQTRDRKDGARLTMALHYGDHWDEFVLLFSLSLSMCVFT